MYGDIGPLEKRPLVIWVTRTDRQAHESVSYLVHCDCLYIAVLSRLGFQISPQLCRVPCEIVKDKDVIKAGIVGR